jgi:hypothetical protein
VKFPSPRRRSKRIWFLTFEGDSAANTSWAFCLGLLFPHLLFLFVVSAIVKYDDDECRILLRGG